MSREHCRNSYKLDQLVHQLIYEEVYKIESELLAACYGSEVVLPIKIEHSVTTPFFIFSRDQNRLAYKNRDIGAAVVEEDCKTGDHTYHHDMVLL